MEVTALKDQAETCTVPVLVKSPPC